MQVKTEQSSKIKAARCGYGNPPDADDKKPR